VLDCAIIYILLPYRTCTLTQRSVGNLEFGQKTK